MVGSGGRPFEWSLRVRWAECDPQGIVFNANYLLYLDIAFTEWMRSILGDPRDLADRGLDAVLGEVNVRFRAPARFDDPITIRLVATELGETSLCTRHQIMGRKGVLSEGWMRHVFVSPVSLDKTTIPAETREALSRQLHDG